MDNVFAKEGKLHNRAGVARFGEANRRFANLIGTGKPYDLKNLKGSIFDEVKYPGSAIWNGRLMRSDDWGNFAYGVAARAYGFSLGWSRFGAGVNQVQNGFRYTVGQSRFSLPMIFIGRNSRPLGGVSTFYDQERDYDMIGAGYNHR